MGGGGTKTVQTTQDTSPWLAQQPYLTNAFAQAQNIYDTTKDNGAYTGDFFATPNQDQLSTFNNAISFANGQGSDVVNTMLNNGNSQVASGNAATNGALTGLQNYNNTDWTAQNIANAQKYASGMDVKGLVDAGMSSAYRNAAENTLPTLYRDSNATGNTDNSRGALAEGVVQRGLNDQAQNLTAQYGADAYKTGLTNAQMDRAGVLSGLQAQGALGGAQSAQGYGALNSALGAKGDMVTMGAGAAQALQGFDQSRIDNERSKYDYAQSFPYQNLGNYMSIVGGQNWGSHSTGTSVTEDKPSAMSSIGSGIGAAGSLFKLFGAFCDQRLKTILVRDIGRTHKGHALHVFYYNDDPNKQALIGPVAQEVELTAPESVSEHLGYKLVDLSLI